MALEEFGRDLAQTVEAAYRHGQVLRIEGGNSKAFYGRLTAGKVLPLGGYSGIVDYEPTDLVITARAGTRLDELEAVLAQQHQMLGFEPPAFGTGATLGGTIACGLSGPARPYAGAARDFVLGISCLDGRGQYMRFGGRVMKNVAGFDISRLLTGAMGTLGVLMTVSLKVLPRPEYEQTLTRRASVAQALELFSELGAQPLPVTAACHFEGQLYIRLTGFRSAVKNAAARIGGDILPESRTFWRDVREQSLAFFKREGVLWRVIVPPATVHLDASEDWFIDWGGGQRWTYGSEKDWGLSSLLTKRSGYIHPYRGGNRHGEVFPPLPDAMVTIHKRLKQAFDPKGILNPGRLYAAF